MKKIEISIKSEVEVSKEIELPYYCNYFGQHLLVISEDKAICCFHGESYSDLSIGNLETFKSHLNRGKQCTKEEFDLVYNFAKKVIYATNNI